MHNYIGQEVGLELMRIYQTMLVAEEKYHTLLETIHPEQLQSAKNLLDYLVLRNMDIRALQDALHEGGLSSLASSEGNIRSQIKAILRRLELSVPEDEQECTYRVSRQLLQKHATALFGPKRIEGIPALMVTLDVSHADDYAEVKNLLLSGMNIARINCAHDDESTWMKMIQNLRRAIKVSSYPCKVYMDLAGPKIRTIVPHKGKVKIKTGEVITLIDRPLEKDEKKVIGCTYPGIISQLKPGEKVLFDDGLVEGLVDAVQKDTAQLLVTRISSAKPIIKKNKGMNFPDSDLKFSALTDYDRQCLPFIIKHADLIGYSFVRSRADLSTLQNAIKNAPQLSIIIKIETPEAVKSLPDLLFQGMTQPSVGVMIARGDLAVEIGFERMSEIQDQILWFCEAGHVPVIYATQILESLNKAGLATRSEVIDAAHAAMAEGVMINKGAYTIEVIETLRDILLRSGGHHVKKRYTFRPLNIASRFLGE